MKKLLLLLLLATLVACDKVGEEYPEWPIPPSDLLGVWECTDVAVHVVGDDAAEVFSMDKLSYAAGVDWDIIKEPVHDLGKFLFVQYGLHHVYEVIHYSGVYNGGYQKKFQSTAAFRITSDTTLFDQVTSATSAPSKGWSILDVPSKEYMGIDHPENPDNRKTVYVNDIVIYYDFYPDKYDNSKKITAFFFEKRDALPAFVE